MKYSRPRGTQDILSPDIESWEYVERRFRSTLEAYGYRPIRTPVFESTDLFLRSVGEETVLASKEMYTFTDRGGRSLTLRPENTASVIRAYLENGLHRTGGVTRLWYIGPMFRYDRPQAGRYRQFHQVGAEAIGGSNPLLDVEIIDVVMTALEGLGFGELGVKLNSVGCPICRPAYTKLLKSVLEGVTDKLCSDCVERARSNPLRVFDCKRCGELRGELPSISSHLCEGCGEHFERVKEYLEKQGRAFEEDPRLVRGLDYYTKTTFEIVHSSLGAQNALCGGGRYDDLVEQCGGPPTPAVGFSAGLERIIGILPKRSAEDAGDVRSIDFYVACVDEKAAPRALLAAGTMRKFGRVELDASLRPLKKQLRNAEKNGAKVSIIVDSHAPDRLMWKDMAERRQAEVEDRMLASFAAERFGRGTGEGDG